MKSRVLAVSTSILSLFLSASTFASTRSSSASAEGGRVGNGGFAYVCRDASGAITSARLLDLWEAEGVPTWAKNDPVDDQLNAVLVKLRNYSPNAWRDVATNLDRLLAEIVYSDRTLNATDDAFPPYKPGPGCAYEQVARYEPVISETGESGLRIAAEIFNSSHFTNSDRAALFFHEAAYLADREFNGATNSQRTRLVVAHLFSDSTIPDTVRLATDATLVPPRGSRPSSSTSNDANPTVVAVPDPLSIRFEVRFANVDGIQRDNLKSMSAAQRSSLYRCETLAFFDFQTSKKFGTGWVKLESLVKDWVYSDSSKTPHIDGRFAALEFTDPSIAEGGIMDNTLVVTCDRREANGKIVPVTFKDALFKIPDGHSLTIMKDGSLLHSDGDIPLAPSVSATKPEANTPAGANPFRGKFFPHVVRGAPTAVAK